MTTIKTLELISGLNASELSSFEKYLISPFFNCSDEAQRLFSCLSVLPAFSKQKTFGSIFPGEAYNDKKLRYVISELNNHLENFLMLKQLKQDPLQQLVIKADAMRLRNCEKSYSLLHQKIISSDSPRDSHFYLQQFIHAERHLNYTNSKVTRKTSPDYTETLKNLDNFYFMKKLQLACEVTNMANILNRSYPVFLIEEIKEQARKNPFCEELCISIYLNILETLIDPSNESPFRNLRNTLLENGQIINPTELSEMYQYVRNYCVRKINQGNPEYLRLIFEIYQEMLSNKALMNNDFLSQWEFKNIVTISLRLEENDWCKKFIEKYINYLNPDERHGALAYNIAYYYFVNKEYHKAIRKLQEANLTDIFYQLDARVIILKSYFELDDSDAFFYHTSAFRLYLLRTNGISDYQKLIYRNLIRFVSAIMRAGNSKLKLSRIKKDIENEKNVADLRWLNSKVESMLK